MPNVKRKFQNMDSDSALSISQTTCINGIFVILVFMSHFCQYVDTSVIPYFQPFVFLQSHLGQLIVAPFLFYSGYGIMEQIKTKGKSYIDDIPRKRAIRTWLHFSLAVILFLIASCFMGEHHPFSQIILSFFAWESIGNSNWYIFAILFLYIVTYLGFKLTSNRRISIVLVILLSCSYIVAMHYVKDGSWWYDTILCYPAGMVLSNNKESIKKSLNIYAPIILFIITFIFYIFKSNLIAHELLAIIFCLDIVLITTFIKIENSILLFLGKHTFKIYILQRIPMILLQKRIGGGYAYLILSLIVTIGLAVIFKNLERKVDLILKL